MVADPAVRRRRAHMMDPNDGSETGFMGTTRQRNQRGLRVSRAYSAVSMLVAVLAVIVAPTSTSTTVAVVASTTTNNSSNSHHASNSRVRSPVLYSSPPNYWLKDMFSPAPAEKQPKPEKKKKGGIPNWLKWVLPHKPDEEEVPEPEGFWWWIDPVFRKEPWAWSSVGTVLDKILTSTMRLFALGNFIFCCTYIFHGIVANLFLQNTRQTEQRLGGFLMFKLLLISAVVTTDTLDLLILFSWYNVLAFLKSLAGMSAATTSHTSQAGQPPKPGVLHLLIIVLLCDFVAASLCVALFHGAGWSMVLLMTTDSALLAVDVLSHILRHISQAMDQAHTNAIQQLQTTQIQLHQRRRQQREELLMMRNQSATACGGAAEIDGAAEAEAAQMGTAPNTVNYLEQSHSIDQRMEVLENMHTHRLNILETIVFAFNMASYALSVLHFLHIWTMHGIQFTLIDGVLALHVHSAVSLAYRKINQRRNLYRIARDLELVFEDATAEELKREVCCICLGTMTKGNVKRVACGHLYHTSCLREVVERAQSMERAKCPLCRANVLDGRRSDESRDHGMNNAGNNNNNNVNGGGNNAANNEHALFRFSTEGILPAWLPLPAFSFEVVRRTPAENPNNQGEAGLGLPRGAPAPREEVGNDDDGATEEGPQNNNVAGPRQQPHPGDQAGVEAEPQPSFLRRFLILAGLIPMSQEEEARALAQLVDMFPQYDRADLQRELRMRGSSEGVVEAVLMGTFSGVARGNDNNDHNADGDEEEEDDNDEDGDDINAPEGAAARGRTAEEMEAEAVAWEEVAARNEEAEEPQFEAQMLPTNQAQQS